MDRPTIFLSSTVHDFADLRSALKDYLEQRGCRVLASEFTDFTRPLEPHSYQACLDTIEQADLFVLFIGRRTGGWHDEAAKVSITRAEYRHAYKLAAKGGIRLLSFVRADVWEHRARMRELAKGLKKDDAVAPAQRSAIVHAKSRFMDDPEAIAGFIDEVTRNAETALAAKGLGPAPIANWITPFSTFAEVRQAIDPLIAHGLSVREAAGRAALEAQLHILLQGIVPLVSKGPLNPVASVLNLRTKLAIDVDQLTKTIRMGAATWTRLVSLTTFAHTAEADPAPLLPALSSDLLLRYDPRTGRYHQTEEHDLLATVVEQARLLTASGRAELADLVKYGRAVDAAGHREVPAHLVILYLHRLLRWVELIGAARALARALGGGPLSQPFPIPRSPLIDQEAALKKETVSLDQIRRFVLETDGAEQNTGAQASADKQEPEHPGGAESTVDS